MLLSGISLLFYIPLGSIVPTGSVLILRLWMTFYFCWSYQLAIANDESALFATLLLRFLGLATLLLVMAAHDSAFASSQNAWLTGKDQDAFRGLAGLQLIILCLVGVFAHAGSTFFWHTFPVLLAGALEFTNSMRFFENSIRCVVAFTYMVCSSHIVSGFVFEKKMRAP
eukprot:m.201027 g.201027  ORF g.201027 m.201027 type:complete len:169 (+) comp16861_c2_seq8:287-793(+)